MPVSGATIRFWSSWSKADTLSRGALLYNYAKAGKKLNRGYRLKVESLEVQTKRLLRRYNLRVKKGLGQHFLIDAEVLKLITSAAELTPADAVIEVGPGLGVLTGELAERVACLATVELDSTLAAILRQNMAFFNNVTVMNDDILQLNPEILFQKMRAGCPGLAGDDSSYKVVANLPYYIASPVLRRFLETAFKPRLIVVMVQKEVAETITAEPGRMKLQSVSVQFYGQPEIIASVPARCFYPVPEVDSAILRVRVYPEPPLAVNEAGFFSLVRAGFTAIRKQLPNSLSQGLNLPKAEVTAWLEEVGIDPKRRPGTLALAEWAELWRVFDRARDEG